MATITTTNQGLYIVSGIVDSFMDPQTIIEATATRFEYIAVSGHTILVEGTGFTYASATEGPSTGDLVTFQFNNSASVGYDMTIDYGAAPLAADDFFSAPNFRQINVLLDEAHNINLVGGYTDLPVTPSAGFAFNGSQTGSIQLDDTAVIDDGGRFFGDGRDAAQDAIFGDDHITIARTNDVRIEVYGDSYSNATDAAIVGGADTIIDNSTSSSGITFIFGDFSRITKTGDVTGGNDRITINHSFQTFLVGDIETLNGVTRTESQTIIGGEDIILGGSGTDSIVGDFDRYLASSVTGDIIHGGDDVLKGRGGNDFIYGDFGLFAPEDLPNATITGGDDVLRGQGGDDSLYGQLGDDRLFGGDDDDRLFGGQGNDLLNGGNGFDSVFYEESKIGLQIFLDEFGDGEVDAGDLGIDTLVSIEEIFATDFADHIELGDADNLVYGFTGSDVISTKSGNDRIYAGEGHDTIDSGDDDDLVFGDKGRDEIIGGYGDDGIYGGEGRDTLFGNQGADFILGGDGNDKIYGGTGSDEMNGGLGVDLLEGGAGQDILLGGVGNDQLFGNNGNDQLDGEANDDVLYGGNGDDILEGGFGFDTLYGGADNDELYGGDEDDILHGDDGDDTLDGDDGNDTLLGGAGVDDLSGGEGDDTLNGEDDDDTLNGDDGDDTLNGGAGDDTMSGGANDDTLVGGQGDDQLSGDDGKDTLEGGNGRDVLNGHSGNDTLNGGNQADQLFGGIGEDALTGGNGADVLYGGDQKDILKGGAGADHMYGEGGDDIQIGGDGSDIFYFSDGFGIDTIEDFNAQDDNEKIDFSQHDQFKDFQALEDLEFYQDDNAVIISDGDDVLVLNFVDINDLDPNDFIF